MRRAWNKDGECRNCGAYGRLRLERCDNCYVYFHKHDQERPSDYGRFQIPPSTVLPDGSIAIPLTRGYVTIVDPIDADLASVKWFAKVQIGGPTYAIRRDGDSELRLHRVILARMLGRELDVSLAESADHKNGNGLDNRRQNLRVATVIENAHNRQKIVSRPVTSQFKGVYWDTEHRKWRATVTCQRQRINLGRFDDEREAALAYDAAAARLHGAFARLNFPPKVA